MNTTAISRNSVWQGLGLFLCLSLLAPLASAEPVRIAFVNVAKLLEESPHAVAALKRLEKEFEPRNLSLLEMRKEVQTMEERLQREGMVMNDVQLRRLERDIRDRNREIRRAQEDYREDLNIRRNEELRKLQKRVNEAIVTLAKRDKYDVILHNNSVVYAAERIDITDKVLKLMEGEMNSAPTNN